jgi:two-component system response regulator YesN
MYRNDGGEHFRLLGQIAAACDGIGSMHRLGAIKACQTVLRALIDYIQYCGLQEEAALRVGIYQLYYLEHFNSWREAFGYLRRLSGILLDLAARGEIGREKKTAMRIREHVERDLSTALSLASVAAAVNYNSNYASRIFKQATGMGIPNYVTRARVAKAQEYLTKTSCFIQQIAEKTGFDSPQHFAMVFKKLSGMTPNEYRKQHCGASGESRLGLGSL